MSGFLEKFITKKYKNKLFILDNASSHRNEKIKELINKKNKLLYSIPYQHYTNTIEQYFGIFKSKMMKLEALKYIEIKDNISKVIKDIPKESYNRSDIYVKKTSW